MSDIAEANHSPLTLFYHDLTPLSLEAHAEWRLRDGDLTFAADTPYVPIVVSEFAPAARSFPIVFAADDATPFALLGLERRNLFLDGAAWDRDAYLPAYVRRYPFGFLQTDLPGTFALAIDAGSDRVVPSSGEGSALFEAGKPTEFTQNMLGFCDAFQREALDTIDFAGALRDMGLLIDRRADATLPDGRTLGLDGFQVVDPEKFARLDAATIVEWHGKGWLALVHFHLASLDRFNVLLARQSASTAASPAAAAA